MRTLSPVIAFWLCFPAFAQAPETVLRVTVNLVQVDAVVTDSKGQHVSDLTADDFRIFQDGKLQKITSFSYIPAKPVGSSSSVTAVSTSITPPKTSSPLRLGQARRTIALVVDDLGLSQDSIEGVRRALHKFVNEQMQPDDLAAIVRTGAGVGGLRQFISDKRLLHAAIDRVHYLSARSGVSAFTPLEGKYEAAISEDPAAQQIAAAVAKETNRSEYFAVGTLGGIQFVLRGLKEIPGRKALVLISEGFTLTDDKGKVEPRTIDSLRRLTDLANRSSTVIYSIDARGLPTLQLNARDNTKGYSIQAVRAAARKRVVDYSRSQDVLSYLASETGGLFLHENNDIAGQLSAAARDQQDYYLIGYDPGEAAFQELKSGGQRYNKLSLKVIRPGLTIRSRTGFYGVPDSDASPMSRSPQQQLVAALSSPFDDSGLRLRLTGIYGDNPERGALVQTLLQIEGRDLTFDEETGGKRKLRLEILLATYDASGEPVDRSGGSYTLRFNADEYKAAMEHGFTYGVSHPIRRPGAYQLRVAVRDSSTGRIGSASQFIQVPDISKGLLTVSGVAIQKSSTSEQAQSDRIGSSQVRIFKPGSSFDYAIQVMNARNDASTNRPHIESQVRLLRDGKQIYASQPAPFEAAEIRDPKRLMLTGSVRLGSDMDPGEYTLQVVVTDKLAERRAQTVAQSADFEVAN